MNGREPSGRRGGWGTGAPGYLQGRHVIRQPNRDGRLHIQYVVVPEKVPQLLLVLVDHLDHSGRGAEASAPDLSHPPRAFPTWASLPSSCFRPLKFTRPQAFQEMGRAGTEGDGQTVLSASPAHLWGEPHTAVLMVFSVPLLVGPLPNSRAGRQIDSLSTDPHPPVHVQDAVGVAVHHVDEQFGLCEVHSTLLVHVELGEKVQQVPDIGWDRLGAPPALLHPQTHRC